MEVFLKEVSRYYHQYHPSLIAKIERIKKKSDDPRNKLVQTLLDQSDTCLLYTLVRADYIKNIPIYFNKVNYIFTANNNYPFTVEYEGLKFSSKEGIIVLSLPDNHIRSRTFVIKDENDQQRTLELTQRSKAQLFIEEVFFLESSKVRESNLFLDILSICTTDATLGIGLKLGAGFPRATKLVNNVYGLFQFHYHFFSHSRFRFGVGYQRMFYLKNIMGFGIGLETGFEFYLFSQVIVEGDFVNIKDDNNWLAFGFPTVYIALPLQYEILSSRKVSIFIGIDPILRIIQNMVMIRTKEFSTDDSLESIAYMDN
ncbi:MAG: hypothetical protein MJB14_11590, partial [Spirochaetes bacterium]|nr:hypothetical protein [Spirochaetota bacterium]